MDNDLLTVDCVVLGSFTGYVLREADERYSQVSKKCLKKSTLSNHSSK